MHDNDIMYGPWTVDTCLSDFNNKQILAVSDHDGKPSGYWIIKVKSDKDSSELKEVNELLKNPPRNMIEVPGSIHQRFGQTETKIWYAMRYYDGHLTKANADKWCEVAVACIQFLSDLHTVHRKVYMDFRLENILVTNNTFVVADYELVTQIDTTKTKDEGRNRAWYFYAKGAEPNKWLYSWRQDLVGLGYLLVELTASLPFYDDFMDRRFGQRANHKSTKDILKGRDVSIRAMANPVLQKYLALIKKVPWNSLAPPPVSFYCELEDLF